MTIGELLTAIKKSELPPETEIQVGISTFTEPFCKYASEVFLTTVGREIYIIAALSEEYVINTRRQLKRSI